MAITSTTAVFRKSGETLNYKPAAAVSCGAIKTIDGLNCIALWDIAANEESTLKILQRGEVIEITTNDAIGSTAAGAAIYVDSSGLATKTSTNNTLLGYAAAAIGATDNTFQGVCA